MRLSSENRIVAGSITGSDKAGRLPLPAFRRVLKAGMSREVTSGNDTATHIGHKATSMTHLGALPTSFVEELPTICPESSDRLQRFLLGL